MHVWIAKDKSVLYSDDSGNVIERYFSCDVFSLRDLPLVRVLILDAVSGFEKKDLETLYDAGYIVMDYNFDWLILDDSTGKIVPFPSSISRSENRFRIRKTATPSIE